MTDVLEKRRLNNLKDNEIIKEEEELLKQLRTDNSNLKNTLNSDNNSITDNINSDTIKDLLNNKEKPKKKRTYNKKK